MTNQSGRRRDAESWDQRYVDDDLPWDTGKPDVHLQGVLREFDISLGPAIEIGCGTGTNSVWLAEQGFEVVGLDVSPTALERARQKAEDAGVSCTFVEGDFLDHDPPGGPFSFAYDRGCFHLFDDAADRRAFAGRLADHLAEGGIWHSLIGSTDGPARDSGPPRRSATEVVAAIEDRFEILQLRATQFDQGDHADKRAWILVARKRNCATS